jgi:hypothetical protein
MVFLRPISAQSKRGESQIRRTGILPVSDRSQWRQASCLSLEFGSELDELYVAFIFLLLYLVISLDNGRNYGLPN